MGLRFNEIEHQVFATMARARQLEQEISKLKKSDGIAARIYREIQCPTHCRLGTVSGF